MTLFLVGRPGPGPGGGDTIAKVFGFIPFLSQEEKEERVLEGVMEQKGVRYGRPGEEDEQVGCRMQTGEHWQL
jgi:hypothetical protein